MAKSAKGAKGAKKAHRHKFRNDMRPSRASSSRAATAGAPTGSPRTLTRGQNLLWGVGGAAFAAAVCAFAAREDVMPLQLANGLLAAVGGTAAVVADNPHLQAVGQGAALAAGAQLGLTFIDSHYQTTLPPKPIVATKGAAKPDAKRQAESLPPGALEAAYERARRRMAMAEAAGQMAA